MDKFGYVYIMTNKNKTVLYVGVTNDLVRRVYEHKNHLIKNSFSDRYNLEYCIYYEEFAYFDLAIKREKELKKWNRQKKENLINKKNPEWKELVNEKGFIRDKREIPHFVTNDANLQCAYYKAYQKYDDGAICRRFLPLLARTCSPCQFCCMSLLLSFYIFLVFYWHGLQVTSVRKIKNTH